MIQNSPRTIGSIIDQLGELKDRLTEINKETKHTREEKNALEQTLLALLQEQGITQSRGTKKTATINEQTFYTVNDWDKFLKFVYDAQMEHLLQKKLSTPGCRELIDANIEIPGTTAFTQQSISIRKA